MLLRLFFFKHRLNLLGDRKYRSLSATFRNLTQRLLLSTIALRKAFTSGVHPILE